MININRLFSFYLLFLSFSLFAQDPTSCIENPDDYYFSLRNISGDNNFDISDEETKLDLKEALTNQIVSEIQVQSTVNQTFKRVNNEFSETEVYNSFAVSNSDAIIFNPTYRICSNGEYAMVYIEKSYFNNLAINYFRNLIRRLESILDISNERYSTNPNYEFKTETAELSRVISTLDSYYGLMISLNVEESLLDSYVEVDREVKTFINSINSLENNLIKAESLISDNDYGQAYDLLTSLKIKYPRDYRIRPLIKSYNDFVRIAKKNEIRSLKSISSSNNYFSLSLGINSEFEADNTSNSNSQDSAFKSFHPNLQLSFIRNNRNKTLGWGIYSKYHVASTQTFEADNSDYEYPFLDNFFEAGVMIQLYLFSNVTNPDYYLDQDYSAFAVSLHAGRYLDNFISSFGEELSFTSISPGFEWYFNNKSSRSQRSSVYFRYSIISSNSVYNYKTASLGFTFNIKSGRKLTEKQKEDVKNEFKTIN